LKLLAFCAALSLCSVSGVHAADLVSGTWVYDSAHEGWNEIHPIKKCLRLGTVRYIANDVIDCSARPHERIRAAHPTRQ